MAWTPRQRPPAPPGPQVLLLRRRNLSFRHLKLVFQARRLIELPFDLIFQSQNLIPVLLNDVKILHDHILQFFRLFVQLLLSLLFDDLVLNLQGVDSALLLLQGLVVLADLALEIELVFLGNF